MHIDKYKTASGEYVGPDDCSWENATDFLHGYVLDFCCCGSPEDALSFVRDALRSVANLKEKVWAKTQAYADWSQETDAKLGEAGAWFMFYFLDSKRLTEHGGSVPGWLTPEGERLLEDLDELLGD